jgi:hypothetical protein
LSTQNFPDCSGECYPVVALEGCAQRRTAAAVRLTGFFKNIASLMLNINNGRQILYNYSYRHNNYLKREPIGRSYEALVRPGVFRRQQIERELERAKLIALVRR